MSLARTALLGAGEAPPQVFAGICQRWRHGLQVARCARVLRLAGPVLLGRVLQKHLAARHRAVQGQS